MDQIQQLEKIVQLGKEISRSSGKDVFLRYLYEFLAKGFDRNLFVIMLMKYRLLDKSTYALVDMLEDKEVLKLLIDSILSSS